MKISTNIAAAIALTTAAVIAPPAPASANPCAARGVAAVVKCVRSKPCREGIVRDVGRRAEIAIGYVDSFTGAVGDSIKAGAKSYRRRQERKRKLRRIRDVHELHQRALEAH